MTVASTALSGVTPFGGRVAPRGATRRVARGIAIGAGMAGAICALAATATMTAAWMVGTARPGNLNSQGGTTPGPKALLFADYRLPPGRIMNGPRPVQASAEAADAPDATFDSKWALAAIPEPARPRQLGSRQAQPLEPALAAKPKTIWTKVAPLAPAPPVPLPRTRPATHDIAQATPAPPAQKVATATPAAPVQKVATVPSAKPADRIAVAIPAAPAQKVAATTVVPAQKIAAAAPAAPAQKLAMAGTPDTTGSIPRETPQPVHNREAPQPQHNKVSLPTPGSRIAVYDISASTVYLPNGEKLEAHSGLGDKMDDPRHVNVRMRGATPPNVYDLTMRESLFHGVAAIRLNPVNESRMFGRDGILAHTYMLGSNGQSNGCVSFKNYAAFLRAFQKGDIDRLVVVAKLGDTMPDLDAAPAVRTARATPAARRWRVADSQVSVPRQHALTGQW